MADLADTSELLAFAGELAAAPAQIETGVPKVLDRTAEDLARAARAAAPKDRPWLSTSDGITVEGDGDPHTRLVTTGLDPRGNPVGMFQEFGTAHMAPRPFLLPQVDTTADELEDELGNLADRVTR